VLVVRFVGLFGFRLVWVWCSVVLVFRFEVSLLCRVFMSMVVLWLGVGSVVVIMLLVLNESSVWVMLSSWFFGSIWVVVEW